MVQIWERCKSINTDHAMFTWRSKLVLSFSKMSSRYQNSGDTKTLWCLKLVSAIFNQNFISH